jgi:hypothetical protein
MKDGWQGCFRECILYLLLEVVEKFAKEFSKLPGPETKELFSMAGLMVIKDFFNWTNEEAMDRYNVDMAIKEIQPEIARLKKPYQKPTRNANAFSLFFPPTI